jgi:hypothetical protein
VGRGGGAAVTADCRLDVGTLLLCGGWQALLLLELPKSLSSVLSDCFLFGL